MGNKAENNGEVLELLDWVTGGATNKDNKQMKKRFWEKESEQR